VSRLLIVSNRLPITVRADDGAVHVERSAGGLATGLSGPHEKSGGLWIGWPGETDDLDERGRAELAARCAELRVVPVTLSKEDIRAYYESFSNSVLWPTFHYLMGQAPLYVPDWEAYESANDRFADAVAAVWKPGDTVWVHDYQLMRVPALLRKRIPEARIGFFLHIPFPASDVFRTLPARAELLEGLLASDLVGFHTSAYLRHFASSVLWILGAPVDVDSVRWKGREVKLGVFPMGVDAAGFAAKALGEDVDLRVRGIRGEDEAALVLVGIDRLDYTKGIPRRLLAFERLLQKHPELREKTRLIQVAVPSRTSVDAYQDFRAEVDRLVGRINGAFATARWTPVHYLYRSLSEQEVIDLYRSADVMLVTPLRDGMNLVAKEFVASRVDGDGVLVLSEFAGASSELAEAVHVNPYDVDGVADALVRALTMPESERRARMKGLRDRVARWDVARWASSFLETLGTALPVAETRNSGSDVEQALAVRLRKASARILFLDYDGTLVPFASTPDLARPDPDILRLLEELAQQPGTDVHVLSGRARGNLAEFFHEIPTIGLHAEHGLWSRSAGGNWERLPAAMPETDDWRGRVRAILEDFAGRTPGALIEQKAAGFAWHYRAADPEHGPLQGRELLLHLTHVLGNVPVEVFAGECVVEVRPHGVHKGRVVQSVMQKARKGAVAIAFGDDRSDDDMFRALPSGGLRVRVGPRRGEADLFLSDPNAARVWLRRLLG